MKLIPPFPPFVYLVIGLAVALVAGQTVAAEQTASATPCMDVLDHFTSPDVPAMGPDETVTPPGHWPDVPPPADFARQRIGAAPDALPG